VNLEFFSLDVDAQGVAIATYRRPPVNAIGKQTYAELRQLLLHIQQDHEIRAVVLAAPAEARAWCAGADLKEVAVAGSDGRQARYDLINQTLPLLYGLDRPVIGAINVHCLGMGMVWASLCDMRVASEEAMFSLPEIERGMAVPLAAFLNRLNMPSAITREMLFTGRKFTAAEMARCGFLNRIVARDRVLAHAQEIATLVARHRPAAIRATKLIANEAEVGDWLAAYKKGQAHSTRLAGEPAAAEHINAFFRK
jgi:enoyl-CoA hydratase/carnithine racemase